MTVTDGEYSLKVKPTNLEKKTLNGESKVSISESYSAEDSLKSFNSNLETEQ